MIKKEYVISIAYQWLMLFIPCLSVQDLTALQSMPSHCTWASETQRRSVQARLVAEAEIKLRSPKFQTLLPATQHAAVGSSLHGLEIHFLFFLELFTSHCWHVGMVQCMPEHAYSLSLLCRNLMIPEEFPYCIFTMFCHLPVLGLSVIACDTAFPVSWFQDPCTLLTRTMFLLCFPTSIQMGMHYVPQTLMKPLVLVSHHCLRMRLSSQGSASTLTPGVAVMPGCWQLVGPLP